MQKVKKRLEEEVIILQKQLKEIEQRESIAPAGRLRISKSQGSVQYYLVNAKNDANGKYIPKEEKAYCRELAQKEYDRKAKNIIQKNLSQIQHFLQHFDDSKIDEAYHKFIPERKELIVPVRLPDENYVCEWLKQEVINRNTYEYEGEYITENGERVRSKSEMILADTLMMAGIPYIYEKPIVFANGINKFPDFTVLNVRERKEYYWEHLGKMDDPDYAEKNIRKISEYQKNGYIIGKNLLVSFETSTRPIQKNEIKQMIREFLL